MRWTCLFLSIALAACATPGRLTPQMRAVVTCVYDGVRAHPGVLSTEVYAIGDEEPVQEYVVEYEFRGKSGAILTGGMELDDGPDRDGRYAYLTLSPGGRNDKGSEEMEFLGDEWNEAMMDRCRLMPTIDSRVDFPGLPHRDPARRRVAMPGE